MWTAQGDRLRAERPTRGNSCRGNSRQAVGGKWDVVLEGIRTEKFSIPDSFEVLLLLYYYFVRVRTRRSRALSLEM